MPVPLPRRPSLLLRRLSHPAVVVALGFATVIALATMVLMLPISRAQPGPPDLLAALFTATSAVCVTGLTVVDTGTYWSSFGQSALLVMFQIGGLGMMTSATVLGLWAVRSMALRSRMLLQSETRALSIGDVRSLLRVILISTLLIEGLAMLVLTLRWALGYDLPWSQAAWLGLFHAISAFNNAGFSPSANNMMAYQHDGWILGVLMACVVIGGIGYPVLNEVWRRVRTQEPRARWSAHSRITLIGTLALLVLGTVGIAWAEWKNPGTLGPLSTGDKWLSALFTSVVSRTAGFNSIDLSAITTDTAVLHYLLMFIGGGSAGTAGGLKITTAGVLLIAVWSELRGNPDAVFAGRRLPVPVVRQALTMLVLACALIGAAVMALVAMTDIPLERIVFEVTSAFATVGVSMGITAQLPPAGQGILIAVMYLGRVGVMTFAVALAAQSRSTVYRYPEEKPIVG